MHAEQHAEVIRKKIQQKQITEASQLFQEFSSNLREDDRRLLYEELSAVMAQAERYFGEAAALEKGRQLEKARDKYKEVENIVIDYPQLAEAFERVDDAVSLIWALQHKDERDLAGPGEQLSSQVYAPKSKLPVRYRILIGFFLLQLVLVGAGLFYTGKLNFSRLKEQIILQITSLGKKAEVGEKSSGESPPDMIVGQKEKNVEAATVGDREQERVIPVNEIPVKEGVVPAVIVAKPAQLSGGDSRHEALPDSEQVRQTASVAGGQDEVSPGMFPSKKSGGYAYTVRSGDTLGVISLKMYGTFSKWPVIANANQALLGNNPDMLQVGTTLFIPALAEIENGAVVLPPAVSASPLNGGGTYTVQFGDSLTGIAVKLFGSPDKWQMIYELNKDVLMTVSQPLKVGQVLRVKGPGEGRRDGKI
ncbi:MAG: LysM peptidoglycan-binding domain-containing protein [Deltaproteobacteria bacterium]|nr:LysM peptidoglycan-binding domain-containing protein [Deltaproteobacteria bacterium]